MGTLANTANHFPSRKEGSDCSVSCGQGVSPSHRSWINLHKSNEGRIPSQTAPRERGPKCRRHMVRCFVLFVFSSMCCSNNMHLSFILVNAHTWCEIEKNANKKDTEETSMPPLIPSLRNIHPPYSGIDFPGATHTHIHTHTQSYTYNNIYIYVWRMAHMCHVHTLYTCVTQTCVHIHMLTFIYMYIFLHVHVIYMPYACVEYTSCTHVCIS